MTISTLGPEKGQNTGYTIPIHLAKSGTLQLLDMNNSEDECQKQNDNSDMPLKPFSPPIVQKNKAERLLLLPYLPKKAGARQL